MSRDAEFREANLRIKRWAKAACETGRIKGGADPYVTHSPLQPPATRWRAWEKMKLFDMPNAEGRTKDGQTLSQAQYVAAHADLVRETEACVAAAPTAAELLHKYALWAQDPNRKAYFYERQLRGQSLQQPPPDPPEWAEYRRHMTSVAEQASERTSEWVKRAARGQMEHLGLLDPVKFELAWREAVQMGLVKG